jgi:hypothetical protein
MTNKSMVGKEKGGEKTGVKSGDDTPRDHENRGGDTFPDSPQLKPELDEPRPGLKKSETPARR